MRSNNTYLVPEVFIIETCTSQDVTKDLRDGYKLKCYLESSGIDKRPKYRFVFDVDDLKTAIREFFYSHYKYLHVCCHGSKSSIQIGNKDQLSYDTFAKLFSGALDRRRVTFSACQLGNVDFVKEFFSFNKTLHSLIASVPTTASYDMLLLWAGVYQKMYLSNLRRDNVRIDFLLKYIRRFSIACENSMMLGYYCPATEEVYVKKVPDDPVRRIEDLATFKYNKLGELKVS